MEKFRGILKKRLTTGIALNGLAIVTIALMALYSRKVSVPDDHMSDAIHGFQVGVVLGLQMVMLVFMAKYSKALKDDNELKKLYIEENDERTKLISYKTGRVGFCVILGGIGMATVISGFFNTVVFITLLTVLVFTVIVQGVLYMYYKRNS